LECFANGAESDEHKCCHSYRVVDYIGYPLFHEKWTVEDDLLLLEGIEMYGLGNWRCGVKCTLRCADLPGDRCHRDVADHVGSQDDKECEAHYINDFLKCETAPLPVALDGLDKEVLDSKPAEKASEEPVEDAVEESEAGGEAKLVKTGADVDEAIAYLQSKKSSFSKPKDKKDVGNPKYQNMPGAELAGYMPLREDFDVEHDNDAELILADMEFHPDDHPSETELKVKIIEVYNGKLDERERRKKFVLERDLLDYKKHQALERRRPKDERELVQSMRVFARFHTAEQHEQFVEGLLTSLRLRKRIQQLQHYRKNGIRTLAEADVYAAEKKKRGTEQVEAFPFSQLCMLF
jgi:transcriptional adapter 2-alpha